MDWQRGVHCAAKAATLKIVRILSQNAKNANPDAACLGLGSGFQDWVFAPSALPSKGGRISGVGPSALWISGLSTWPSGGIQDFRIWRSTLPSRISGLGPSVRPALGRDFRPSAQPSERFPKQPKRFPKRDFHQSERFP